MGQLLRANSYKPYSVVTLLLHKHSSHKPNATNWEDRLEMVRLTMSAIKLSFKWHIMPIDNADLIGYTETVDRRFVGADSLIEHLQNPKYWSRAQRWPLLALSIPGIEKRSLIESLASKPPDEAAKVQYEYVSTYEAPMMNWDFDT